MQEQEKMEMVWQAPELVELGELVNETKHTFNNSHGDSTNMGS